MCEATISSTPRVTTPLSDVKIRRCQDLPTAVAANIHQPALSQIVDVANGITPNGEP
jgi:hypothetical protein